MSVRPVPGATDTLQSGDNNNIVAYSSSGAVTATLPPGLPRTAQITLLQIGSGAVTVVPASGVTLHNSVGSDVLDGQWSSGVLIAYGQDIYVLAASQDAIPALQALPDSDAGLASGDLFWNGGFLCKKV